MIFVTGGCFQGKQQWVLQNCQVQPFRVADGAVCSMEAVSYTHLDVYKRQRHCRMQSDGLMNQKFSQKSTFCGAGKK